MNLEGGTATNSASASASAHSNAFATLEDDSGSEDGRDPMAAEPSLNSTTAAAGQHINDSHDLLHKLATAQQHNQMDYDAQAQLIKDGWGEDHDYHLWVEVTDNTQQWRKDNWVPEDPNQPFLLITFLLALTSLTEDVAITNVDASSASLTNSSPRGGNRMRVYVQLVPRKLIGKDAAADVPTPFELL